ncbi:hypothetical protein O9G_005291 [Rozella allomycis CSF55]|uniref:Uncharacterized protein n=1 Tax=Rozella allomycis (strain CSF55) TaxID=988480 RepID=A0A075AWL8_ROZAC|nr:hypothetical protein O9G_005291 [Rozella allomycis CSF55]|eukprot:EPZ32959.1 hypothetical protein O9G_005291 [Rozella allomycis CSF55]
MSVSLANAKDWLTSSRDSLENYVLNKRQKLRLYKYDEIPNYLKDNEFIHSGYAHFVEILVIEHITLTKKHGRLSLPFIMKPETYGHIWVDLYFYWD